MPPGGNGFAGSALSTIQRSCANAAVPANTAIIPTTRFMAPRKLCLGLVRM